MAHSTRYQDILQNHNLKRMVLPQEQINPWNRIETPTPKDLLIHKMDCFTNKLEKVQLNSINSVGTIGSPYGKKLKLDHYIIS